MAARRKKHDYPGPPASKTYDARFESSYAVVPYLESHVPQGLAIWGDWNGEDQLLVTSYSPSDARHAYIIGREAGSGKHVGTAKVKASHVGGLAIFADLGWAYVSSGRQHRVRKYLLDRLRRAIERSACLEQEVADIKVFGASFSRKPRSEQDPVGWPVRPRRERTSCTATRSARTVR
jgi:hypothetical protein